MRIETPASDGGIATYLINDRDLKKFQDKYGNSLIIRTKAMRSINKGVV